MVKQTLEGLSILPAPPARSERRLRPPVVKLDDGLVLDDSVFEASTLLLGPPGTGKSVLMDHIMAPVLAEAASQNENAVIFCAKREYLKYRRPQDPVISVDATEPNACWNIFREMAASRNPALTARDIASSLTRDQHSDMQPFFENSCNDLLYNTILFLFEEQQRTGEPCSNWHLADFLGMVSLRRDAEYSWYALAEAYPERFGHILDYLGDGLDQGFGIISEIRTLLHKAFWGSFANEKGTFSAIESLKKGGQRIFLFYDYANASEASVKIYRTILNLLFKHSIDEENRRRTWFFIDEGSLLPETCLADAMSLGRGAGFRLIWAQQSAQLMTRHYSKEDAESLLSLFPNVLCLRVMDSMSRHILADRYGECLCSYSFQAAMQKVVQHTEHRPVVADYDFAMIQQKGDGIFSIPAVSNTPFFYHGYRKELENV